MVLFQDNPKLVEARFFLMSSWMAFKWISTSSRFRNSSGYVFFYFVEQKNVSLYLLLPLFQHFAWNLFDFFRLVSLFSHSANIDFEHQLLSKAIQNEQSQYKN